MYGRISIFDLVGNLDGIQGRIKIMIFRLDIWMDLKEKSNHDL